MSAMYPSGCTLQVNIRKRNGSSASLNNNNNRKKVCGWGTAWAKVLEEGSAAGILLGIVLGRLQVFLVAPLWAFCAHGRVLHLVPLLLPKSSFFAPLFLIPCPAQNLTERGVFLDRVLDLWVPLHPLPPPSWWSMAVFLTRVSGLIYLFILL